MAEQWIIQVQGKEYGPADLATLREWKADGRVLPANPARQADVNEAHWKTAGDIPGLFRVEPPPVQGPARNQRSALRARLRRAKGNQRSEIEEQTAESEYFGRNLSNLFSRFLSILLPLIAEHRPDCLRRAHESFHRHRAGCECRFTNTRCGRVRLMHAHPANRSDSNLHCRHPDSHRRACDRTSDRFFQRP